MKFRSHEVRPQRQANYQPAVYGLGHEGLTPTGVRAELITSTQDSTAPINAETERLIAVKDTLLAEVDRIQKRVEIRGGDISEGDAEVLSSLRKVLKALDPNDSELLTRINTLLKS